MIAMNTSRLRSAGAILLLAALGPLARADPIAGSVGFAGVFSTDNNADFTQATTFTDITAFAFSATGDYAGIPLFSPVDFSTFAFNATSVSPLWSVAGGTYSFNATVVDVVTTASSIVAHGTGMAFLTGYDPTPGFWNLAGTGSGLSLTFAAGTTVPASVPDGGSTVILLGASLVAAGAFQWTRRMAPA